LCDGCGRCCLVKLEDDDSGEIHLTSASCRLLDCTTCRCTDYDNRHRRVSDCIELDVENVASLSWLPATCAYRLVAEHKSLAWWHPLVSGTQQSVIDAGISVSGKVVSEDDIDEDDLPDMIRKWPLWHDI